jgi:CRP-like cAMP-binding protein
MKREKSDLEYLRLLRQSPLLLQSPDGAAEELLREGWRSLPFRRGQIIFGQATDEGLGLLVSGNATARSGNGLVLRAFGKGDIFGAAALFASAAEPFSEIVAESAGEALLLPADAVRRFVSGQRQAAENYIRFLAQRIVFLNRKITSLSSGGVIKRLAAHLTTNCRPDAVGRPICSGTISNLALNLGVSRASVYRALEELLESGCLHRGGKTIVIDRLDILTAYK